MANRIASQMSTCAYDLQLLNGWWIATEAILAGRRLPDDLLDDFLLRLHNGTFVIASDVGTFTIDRLARPAAMDVLLLNGRNRKRCLPAIFERAGGMLRICYDLSGVQRPRQFAATTGTRLFLATYRLATEAVHYDTTGRPIALPR